MKLLSVLILSATLMTSAESKTSRLEAKMSQMRTKIAQLQQDEIQPKAKAVQNPGDTPYMFDCYITRENTTNDIPPVTFDGCGGTKFYDHI